jgi:5-methylcytosine-specific restriction endonuclease McrA
MTVSRAKKIFERDNGICVYCGAWADTIDHITPRNHGGKTLDDNLVAACFKCNMTASDYLFPSIEHKRRYILLRRFGKKAHAREFREQYRKHPGY